MKPPLKTSKKFLTVILIGASSGNRTHLYSLEDYHINQSDILAYKSGRS